MEGGDGIGGGDDDNPPVGVDVFRICSGTGMGNAFDMGRLRVVPVDGDGGGSGDGV